MFGGVLAPAAGDRLHVGRADVVRKAGTCTMAELQTGDMVQWLPDGAGQLESLKSDSG